MNNLMDTSTYGLAARRKLGAVPPDFHVFRAEWIGAAPADWKSMRVTGAQFKGRLRLAGTTVSVIVTREEMMAACADRPSAQSEPKAALMSDRWLARRRREATTKPDVSNLAHGKAGATSRSK